MCIRDSYSLKGRSLESVLRHLEEWQKQIALVKKLGCVGTFPEPKVRGFEYETKNHRYAIKRLKTYHELAEEGRKMKHCVAGYVDECVKGESSIWSIRMLCKGNGFKRLATVEIELFEDAYQLNEFQGKCNTKPTNLSIHMVKEWAKQQPFEISEDWKYEV